MAPKVDPDTLKLFSFNLFSKLEGAVTAGMIHLGDRLGLYAAMAGGDGFTSVALAERTGLHERWVREWLHNQVGARFVTCDDLGADRPVFRLSPEAVLVLATPEHPAYGMGMFHRLPQTMAALEEMPEAFRTGIGHDYDSHGPEGAVGIERSFEPWNRNFLVPTVLPELTGAIEKLEKGCSVADIGCGAGSLVLLLARTFPNSTFIGYDISRHALERANEKLIAEGLKNARFVDPRVEAIPDDHRFDIITTFDCIHDMTRPTEMMGTIKSALSPQGSWLLVDIKAQETLEENITKNPMASMLYGISVLSCMSSAMSSADGEGLGTLGLPASLAESMAREAGFTSFRRMNVEHNVNAFYEIRP